MLKNQCFYPGKLQEQTFKLDGIVWKCCKLDRKVSKGLKTLASIHDNSVQNIYQSLNTAESKLNFQL